jgi:hypothetical protein
VRDPTPQNYISEAQGTMASRSPGVNIDRGFNILKPRVLADGAFSLEELCYKANVTAEKKLKKVVTAKSVQKSSGSK